MTTTDAGLALDVIRGLDERGVKVALLHGYEELLDGRESGDTDVVVDQLPAGLVRSHRSVFEAQGLVPVLAWPYDVGGSLGLFLCNRQATAGVQLDILHDPRGLGRYGVRSGALLEWVERRGGIPVLTEPAKVVYLWQKRLAKGQREALLDLSRQAGALPPERVRAAAASLLGDPAVAKDILEGVPSGRRPPSPYRHVKRALRVINRLRHPIGCWVHCYGDADGMVQELAQRFARFLPHVRVSQVVPGPIGLPFTWAKGIAPVVWRAGLALSLSESASLRWPFRPAGTIFLDRASGDDQAAAVVRIMDARLSA